MERCEPLSNRQMVDLPDVRFLSLAAVWIRGRQIIEELKQVALVIAQGVRAHVALVAQMVEELCEMLIDHAGTSRKLFGVIDRLKCCQNRFLASKGTLYDAPNPLSVLLYN